MSIPFVSGIHRWSVNSPHKAPVTQQMFPFDDFIMFFHNLRLFAAIKVVSITKNNTTGLLLHRWISTAM